MNKTVPAPGSPSGLQRFVGGFRQAWGESLAPTVGRAALVLLGVVLVGIAALGALAAIFG